MSTDQVISKEQYDTFRGFLEKSCGILLGDNKHYLVTSRLNRLTKEFSFDSLGALLDSLKKNSDRALRERVIDAMTTNETSWFRDTYPFEILKVQLFPELAKAKPNPLRIWSAAASSGQESYSIIMTFDEYRSKNPGQLQGRLEIIATDISPSVLKVAQSGKYDDLSIMRGLSAERRDKYFNKLDSGWEVKPSLKGMVRFSEMNLQQSYNLLGKFDIIFCRNVLIYFSSELKTDILERMAACLNPGGILILGGSESPSGYTKAFEMVRFPEGVVYRLRSDWKA
ncbi:MAG: protein-glutamate O-methyltransferase CheR [Gammaproteobacteria bacterium]